MLVDHVRQNTNPNESGMQFSPHISGALHDAFTAAGVSLDSVDAKPDGTVTIGLPKGAWIAIGADDDWITATCHEASGDYQPLFEGTDLSDLAATVAQRIG